MVTACGFPTGPAAAGNPERSLARGDPGGGSRLSSAGRRLRWVAVRDVDELGGPRTDAP
jgi:hypothetical protein